MKFLFYLLIALSITLSAKAQDLLSARAFTEEVLAAYLEEDPDFSGQVSETDPLQITYGNIESPGVINTHNRYKKYLEDPESKADIIRQLVRGLVAFEDEGSSFESMDRLIFLLRPSEYGEYLEKVDAAAVPHKFLEGLVWVYFFDSEAALMGASPDVLEEFGLDGQGLRELAIKNLRARMGSIVEDDIDSLVVLYSENGLIAGLPLLPETCDGQHDDAAYYLSDRNQLLRADRNDFPDSLLFLNAVFMGMSEEGVHFTDEMFSCAGGEWRSGVPDVWMETIR